MPGISFSSENSVPRLLRNTSRREREDASSPSSTAFAARSDSEHGQPTAWLRYPAIAEATGSGATAQPSRSPAMAKDFHEIPKEKKDLIKVGIVGEIYVKYAALGNNGLEDFLLSQGCEYMIPGTLGFFQYCFANMEKDHEYYGGGIGALLGGRLAGRISEKWEEAILEALEPYPEFVPPVSFDKVKELADRVIDRGVKMGEGWLLPGETAELIEKGYSNVICAQPFGCLPNHIVGKGTIHRLRELYPNANIFPVDYDAGASKVNQENRIKLMLAIAREQEGRQ